MRGTQWWRLMRTCSTWLPFYYLSPPDSSRVGSSFWAEVGSVGSSDERPSSTPSAAYAQAKGSYQPSSSPNSFLFPSWKPHSSLGKIPWLAHKLHLESFSYDYLVLKEATTYNEIDLRVNKMMLRRRQTAGCDGPLFSVVLMGMSPFPHIGQSWGP